MVTDRRLRMGVGILGVLAALAAGVLVYTRLPDVTTARLPGAAGGSNTYPVTAKFTDVLDLVPNSTVRVADVPIGRVTQIGVAPGGTAGHVAVVHLEIDRDHPLPAGTTATIRTTSMLGEKYIALTAPTGGTGSLEATGEIPLHHTAQDVEVEQLLASLGTLLNGGSLQQLSVLTREFSTALDGREASARRLLGNLEAIVRQLDRGRADLVAAIASARRLSAALAAQDRVIGDAVAALDPASGVLARQERALVGALRSLDTLDAKATRVIRASTRATVADLEALAPVTRELGKVADELPANLTTMVTYPFPDNAVRAFSGSYGAVKGSVVLDLKTLLAAVVPTPQKPDMLPTQPGPVPRLLPERSPDIVPGPAPDAVPAPLPDLGPRGRPREPHRGEPTADRNRPPHRSLEDLLAPPRRSP